MSEIDVEAEKVLVTQVIDKWLEGWSRQDVDIILKHVADDFTLHLPLLNWSTINGSEELKGYVLEYYNKLPRGPVIHGESRIGVSTSGDIAYEIGRHDHVVIEESGDTHLAPWNHLIVLRKIQGEWKIIAISETQTEPQ